MITLLIRGKTYISLSDTDILSSVNNYSSFLETEVGITRLSSDLQTLKVVHYNLSPFKKIPLPTFIQKDESESFTTSEKISFEVEIHLTDIVSFNEVLNIESSSVISEDFTLSEKVAFLLEKDVSDSPLLEETLAKSVSTLYTDTPLIEETVTKEVEKFPKEELNISERLVIDSNIKLTGNLYFAEDYCDLTYSQGALVLIETLSKHLATSMSDDNIELSETVSVNMHLSIHENLSLSESTPITTLS